MDSDSRRESTIQVSTEAVRSDMEGGTNQEDGSRGSPPAGEKRKRHSDEGNGHDGRDNRKKGANYKRDWKTGSRTQRRKDYNASTDGRRAVVDDARQRDAQKPSRSLAVHATQFSTEEVEAEEKRPKRKVAVMVGYAGTGYFGMQLNDTHKTIEGDLFQAFVKAGAISKANANDPRKVSFVRCARTDKGVHAAGNVISLKLVIEDPDIVAKINENLVPQIRVWGIERTMNSFSAYKHVDSRIYEYLIPTHCFLPPHPRSHLGRKLKEHAEEAGDVEGWKSRQQDVNSFWDEAFEKYIKPVQDSIEPELRDRAWETAFTYDESLNSSDTKESSGQTVSEPTVEITTLAGASDPSKGTKTVTKLELAQRKLKAAILEAKRAWRITPERLERVKSALSRYEGVRNYHNYTVRVRPQDASAKRVIKSFAINGGPFLIDGVEWLSLKVHGQSFMMHQIRKMVGMAALIVRCGTHEGRLQDSMTYERISIPRAPGLGLLLERPIFEGFNKKLRGQGNQADRNDIGFESYHKEMEEFKQREIYDRIHREEAASSQFHQLFWSVDNLKKSQFLYLTSKGLAACQGWADEDKKDDRAGEVLLDGGEEEEYVENEGN